MNLGLEGKVVLITGGSKGIGRQTGLTFAKEGASVAMVARNVEDLEKAKSQLQSEVPQADVLTIPADLQHEAGAVEAVQKTVEHFGKIDILVNCAGAAPGGLLLELTEEDWDFAMGLKFRGYVRMAKATIPQFLKQKHGVIVNVVGNDGVKPSWWELTGTAVNAADLAVMTALGNQYGNDNIRINCVNPGPVDTGRWETLTQAYARDLEISIDEANEAASKSMPFGRIATAQEVADVVVFLASERAGFVHNSVVNIDGGQMKDILDRKQQRLTVATE
ncbi:short-chain dehydrogenase [Aneurinibacillus migulanus]|uniref:SDR family NAD(P)-dependent oxidoreductase n=1 Tax=Aneurinibacillus migulanus TaxID=47500 RepID=UPI0005BA350F|nr:SDR family NAD(P)-dependent oxidoreductase [Aneurinibacillus migulanus]KIV53341.1 short-chain dehydrogenase [Aneurinibacillus migulanus]KPD05173.1 short-chain dehydrogenase [Aneurinibacillus migulanus]MCP1356320.1 SDR family oxidoreductase [Aneurinibacillus migulanus]MED4730708.1 SDR family oxidoreductase [Aneurinibacillus migulanus]CEH30879.1 Short-chain dehydrogenase/reductase SDR [Aneurinibacillus migulanus]